MTTSERIYRILLKAYPHAYLREYGEPMAQAFRDQLRDAAFSRLKLVRLWIHTFLDLAGNVLTVHASVPTANEGAKAVFFAHYEAAAYSHPEVTLEDLLLGALRVDQAFATRILGTTDIRAELQASPPTVPCMAIAHGRVSEACKRALQSADQEAVRSGAPRAAARHLIAGILHESDSLAARILQEHGVDLPRLRSMLK